MVGEAVFGAVAGLGKVASDIIGVSKSAKIASKSLGIQRDIANRQLALQETGLAVAVQESDKDREANTYKLNRLLQFYTDQGNSANETAAVIATTDKGGIGLSPWLLLAGGAVLIFFVMGKGK